MPQFTRFEYCHHCGGVMGDETYVCPAVEERVCPGCWLGCQEAGYAPAPGVETDERFMRIWIDYGIEECEAYLRKHAEFDAFVARKPVYWEGGDENDALS